MDLLWIWMKQGLQHIFDLDAYDHMLYILVLALPFLHKKFRPLVYHITAFTLGHTLALAISALFTIPIDQFWIEVGILASILFTAFANIFLESKLASTLTYLITLCIGLIHGMGFGRYFKSIHSDNTGEFLTSLFGFNLGVELAQLIIVTIAYLLVQRLDKVAIVDNKQFVKSISIILFLVAAWLLYKLF